MEIWIIGLIFVALMVFVSTRIKKSAARAYEREEIKTEKFNIIKPDDLVHPLRDKSEFAFEAYSNDYGEGEARSIWRASAQMRILSDTDFRTVRTNIKKSADKVVSEEIEENAPTGQKIRLLETERIEDEINRHEFWKIVEDTKSRKIYELKVSVLENYSEQYLEKVREMVESFTVK